MMMIKTNSIEGVLLVY